MVRGLSGYSQVRHILLLYHLACQWSYPNGLLRVSCPFMNQDFITSTAVQTYFHISFLGAQVVLEVNISRAGGKAVSGNTWFIWWLLRIKQRNIKAYVNMISTPTDVGDQNCNFNKYQYIHQINTKHDKIKSPFATGTVFREWCLTTINV